MAIATTCKRCGLAFEADRDVIFAGAGRWRFCPECRNEGADLAERALADERAARRRRPRDWWAADRARRRQERAG